MGIIIGIIIFAIYFYLCHKVALKAQDKGKNYFLWFVMAVLIDPILVFVLLLIFT